MDIRAGMVVEGPNGADIRLIRVIGAGGFGQVFVGQLPSGTEVAVKTVLTAALSDSELKVLQNEIQLAPAIQHPNVVRVLHVNDGKSGSLPPYLVMEVVSGGNLAELLEERRLKKLALLDSELQAMFLQLARGMQAVNAYLVHRDLKPANILVDAGSGELKISDFGLAKLANAVTRSDTLKGWGTPPYMAPEAFDGTSNTVAMDIYAMGVVFFEMAASQLPLTPRHGVDTVMAWASAHLGQTPADLSAIRKDVSPSLVQVIQQMLQKDPSRRPTWDAIIKTLESGMSANPKLAGVHRLLGRANARLQEESAAEAREREAADKRERRYAILQVAAREPLDLLKGLVESYNAQALNKLIYKEDGTSASVRRDDRSIRLQLGLQIADEDHVVDHTGLARIVGGVVVSSTLRMRWANRSGALLDFGGFNLAYIVGSPADEYGVWRQYRFSAHPLHASTLQLQMSNWNALDLETFVSELASIRSITTRIVEHRQLDLEWFTDLLTEVV